MKALLVIGIASVMLLGWGTPASAQTALKPDQIAIASHVSVLPTELAPISRSSAIATGADLTKGEERHDRIVNRIWITSILVMIAGSALDAETSWGKQEANGLLASPDGAFGARGVSVKAGAAASIIIPQILLRKHKDLRARFAVGNFAGGAAFTGVAIHNLGIQPPK